MTAAVVLAGVSSVTLAVLGVAVFLRQQTQSHLLIALVLLAFTSRTVIAALTLGGVPSGFDYHIVECLLDPATAGLVLAAIYYVRSIECGAGIDDP